MLISVWVARECIGVIPQILDSLSDSVGRGPIGSINNSYDLSLDVHLYLADAFLRGEPLDNCSPAGLTHD